MKYISCLSIALQVPFPQFFSPYIPPENLTLAASNELQDGSYGKAIAEGTIVGDALISIPVEMCE